MASVSQKSTLSSSSPLSALNGVGEKRVALYRKLGLNTIQDLTEYYPRSYLDFSHAVDILNAPLHCPCTLRVRILAHHPGQYIRKGLTVYKVEAADDTAALTILFYNSPYRSRALELGREYLLYGKIEGNLLRRTISSPEVLEAENCHAIQPIYSLTEGLFNKGVITNMKTALQVTGEQPEERFPQWIIHRFSLFSHIRALEQIHFPDNAETLEKARERLSLEELLGMQLALRKLGAQHQRRRGKPMKTVPMNPWYSSFPFVFTGAQKRAIGEILADMRSSQPMNRLLQGDVGSGKTAVAATAAYFAICNGWQTALLAPTEILAEQHFQTLSARFQTFGYRAALLTGSTPKGERAELLESLQQGNVHLLVGTHALLQQQVQFSNLGLVITDEQHRFGVNQRASLYAKGVDPHVLVMSATPIPRTLALLMYGDLHVSVLDELPPGRKPISTLHISSAKRKRMNGFLTQQLLEGRQIYIVCPLIDQEEPESSGMQAAAQYIQQLRQQFPNFRCELLHGKMKSLQKEQVMRAFQKGEIGVLVSTTVIEVGVDVPNATVMVIENAERFGLSQLHQLRGRVGRGGHQSYCILISDAKNEENLIRLRTMCSTNNGFTIAEQDLKLRGPGDFFGQRQHGIPSLRMANLLSDMRLVEEAARLCDEILSQDPELSLPENQGLQKLSQQLLANAGTLN